MSNVKTKYESLSDEELALRFQNGEKDCAHELVLRYEPLVKKLASDCFDLEDREDLKQLLRILITDRALRFQPKKGKRLSAYLKAVLEGEQEHFFAMIEKEKEIRRLEMWYTREELAEDHYFVRSEKEVKRDIRNSDFPPWAKDILLIMAEGHKNAAAIARILGKDPDVVRVQVQRLRKLWLKKGGLWDREERLS